MLPLTQVIADGRLVGGAGAGMTGLSLQVTGGAAPVDAQTLTHSLRGDARKNLLGRGALHLCVLVCRRTLGIFPFLKVNMLINKQNVTLIFIHSEY